MSNSKELDQTIRSLASKRYKAPRIHPQIEFVANALIVLSVAAAGKGVVDLGVAGILNNKADVQLAATHPDLIDHTLEIRAFDSRLQGAANAKNAAKLRELLNSEEFQRIELLSEQQQLRDSLRSELFGPYQGLTSVVGDGTTGVVEGVLGMVGSMIGGFFSGAARETRRERERKKDKFSHDLELAVGTFRPEWLEAPVSPEEYRNFFQRLFFYPPIGGKISIPGKEGFTLLEPSFTVEQQVEDVTAMMERRDFGYSFIHQLTVQGRLPDRFKYAALALILGSPHRDDWNKTFYKTPWGKVAPLIHDGGNTMEDLNPEWRGIEGRTDFIRRIVFIDKPELLQIEPARLALEARAWQRLGLALHAEVGTAPTVIPQDTRDQLAAEWQVFESRMDFLLREFDIEGAALVSWFNYDPSNQFGFKNRFEAEWEPIQKELLHLEEVRWEYPAIQEQAVDILRDSSIRIDQVLGLIPEVV